MARYIDGVLQMNKPMKHRARKHTRPNGGLLHCNNVYVIRISQPWYDRIDWNKKVIERRKLCNSRILAGYDYESQTLQVEFARIVYTFRLIPAEIWVEFCYSPNPEEYFMTVLRRKYPNFMRQKVVNEHSSRTN